MGTLCLHNVEAELLGALSRHGARYAVIGGHAVQYYGHLRPARDLDICVEPSQANAELVAGAFASVSSPVRLTDEQISRLAAPNLQMRINGIYHLEVLTRLTGLDIAAAIDGSVTTIEHGQQVRVVSLDHLIALKRALGRPEDLADIEALEKVRCDA